MFNRLIRCLSITTKPFRFGPATDRQRVMKLPLVSPQSTGDVLMNCYCSSANQDVETGENIAAHKNSFNVTVSQLQSALQSDPSMEKRYKVLQLEIDVMRQTGKLVPDDIKPQHWLQLLREDTRTARRKYLRYLFTIEKKQQNEKKKKEEARIERDKLREETEPASSEYRLHKNSMFLRIYDSTMNQFYNGKLFHAMQFGPKLIIDCGYDSQMTARESTECAKQLAYMFAQNRVHRQPFDLHFCNVNKSSALMEKFNRIIPTAYDMDFPLNISEKSYTESFDKDQLVYLTPHCNNDMQKYDPECIYIVGAIVDKTNSEPLSLARAKKDGLKMAKLPLDKYLLWGSGGSKRLPLNHMVNILTDIRVTGDWQKALVHIPRRKLERDVSELRLDYVPKEGARIRELKTNVKQREPGSFSFEARQKRRFNK